jgi:agmatine deiminase
METNRKAPMEMREQNRPVTLGLIQRRMTDNVSANMDNALERTREAASRGAQIICHQELYRTRYFPQNEEGAVGHLAETIPGDSTNAFSNLARELGVVVILPLFEKDGQGNFYNSAAVIDEKGTLLESYRKVHIPHDPLFYEQNYFTAGNLGYPVFHTRYASFSVLICYDQWFPEAARVCALHGAGILFYPTAIAWIKDEDQGEEDWLDAWQTIQRSHAIANGVHVAAVNRVGEEGRLQFWGGSFVCDAFGKVLQRAGSEDDEILIVEIDPAMNQRVREGWGFLRNRHPETYERLTHIE